MLQQFGKDSDKQGVVIGPFVGDLKELIKQLLPSCQLVRETRYGHRVIFRRFKGF